MVYAFTMELILFNYILQNFAMPLNVYTFVFTIYSLKKNMLTQWHKSVQKGYIFSHCEGIPQFRIGRWK